jgi:hypothetical protein
MLDQMTKPFMTANMGHGSSSTVTIDFESSPAGPGKREAGLYSVELELDDGETSKVFYAWAAISLNPGTGAMDASNSVQKASNISVRPATEQVES